MKIPTPARILTMNRGSSTLKAALYEADPQEKLVVSIKLDSGGSSGERLKISDAQGETLVDSSGDAAKSGNGLESIFQWLDEQGYLANLSAVGHRLVHGGARFEKPQQINAETLVELKRLLPLDPEHLPQALEGIRFIAEKLPEIPQIACFDTAFHHTLPEVARMYALPRADYESGVRRYGFHGLSYEYILGELRVLEGWLAKRIVVAHLGGGCSMAAIRDGKSVDTSMGFTPLEGLVMGTRSGDVDPGALIYFLEQGKMSPDELNSHLNRKSGLLGVSGSSADMRDLVEKAPNDAHAAEAIELFCYRAKKYLGAYAAVLGGLDVLVFTGGIGERAAQVREKICAGLEFLGIQLDPQRNQVNAPLISWLGSSVKIRVIETNEDLMIARHVRSFLTRSE
jgi:acetate kinase